MYSHLPYGCPYGVHSPSPFLQTPTFPPQPRRIFPLLPGVEVRLPCEDPVLPVEGLAIIGASVLFVVFSPRLVSPASEFNGRGKPHALSNRGKSLILSPEHLDLDHDFYEYEQGLSSNIIEAGRLKTHIQFWKSIGASPYILDVIDTGYHIPFYSMPPVSFSNNR